MKLKKWLQTNNLFLRVISVAVAGVILATILITWISIQTLQKNYLKCRPSEKAGHSGGILAYWICLHQKHRILFIV